MDAVTQVLLGRTQEADRLNRMVMVSLLLHAVAITAFLVAPAWRGAQDENAHVMMISIAGPEGPIQGRNPMAGKRIQEVAPDTAKPRTDTPPALTKPEMVEPLKNVKPAPKPTAKPEPKKEEPQLRGRTPTQGAEVKAGAARIDTKGAAVPFGGLATGGGGMNDAYTNIGDFCCPEYLITIRRLIFANWRAQQGVAGSNVMKFVIKRDGTITDITVDQGANQYLNMASQRALEQTRQLPPLPQAFTPPQLTVYVPFQYRQ